VLAGPAAWPSAPGVRFGGYRTVAFGGCTSVKVPDTARNRAWLGKMNASLGVTGYPVVQLMTLVETGTRALIGAVFGPLAGEAGYARRLLHLLRPDMLVLADRGFDATAFLAEVAETDAQFLVRLNAARRPPVMARLDDGTFLSRIGALPVRIIPAHVTVTCADGTTLCVPITSSASCDQPIFVDQATDVSLSSDAVQVEVDRLGQRFQRRGAVQGAVRPMLIVVGLILTQDLPQMGLVPDESAVQELAAASPDPPFGDRVHARRLDVAEHGPDPGVGEDGVERGGEV
jgi:hypothetical protein